MVTVRTYFCQAEKTLLGGVSRTDILPPVCARGRERSRCRPAGFRTLPTRVGSSPSWTRSWPRTAPTELGDGEGSRRALQHVQPRVVHQPLPPPAQPACRERPKPPGGEQRGPALGRSELERG